MKRLTIAALIICLSHWTWGQTYAGSITRPDMNGHPQTATVQTLPTGGGFSSATGDRPASDFPHAESQKSLGAVARENREAQKTAKQSKVVYIN
jgi:hypothetical protein